MYRKFSMLYDKMRAILRFNAAYNGYFCSDVSDKPIVHTLKCQAVQEDLEYRSLRYVSTRLTNYDA